MKKIKGIIYRYCNGRELDFRIGPEDDEIAGFDFCYAAFRRACPALTKGMRKGSTRNIVLTQLKKGIKVELA